MNEFRLLCGIAIGGALGSLGRHAFCLLMSKAVGETFPWGTLLVNVLGAFGIGLLSVLPDGEWKKMAMIGVMGGFTTFSAFSLQTYELIRSEMWWSAGLNVLGSVFICLVFVALGVWAGQLLFARGDL